MREGMVMSVVCRTAVPEDVEALFELIEGYAAKGIMLPRSREALARTIDTFIVASDDGRLIGCGSLCRLGSDLVEIRSLGIADGYKGQGIGSKLVDALIAEAKLQGIPKVMALTYESAFFQKTAFRSSTRKFSPRKYGQIASTARSSIAAMKLPSSGSLNRRRRTSG